MFLISLFNITKILIIILCIVSFDFDQNMYALSILAPFSQNEIHYVHDFQVKSLNLYKEKGTIFTLKTLTKDITEFLDNLDEKDNYWLSLSFHPTLEGYANEEGMKLYINDPILINKDSSPLLLTNFIMNRLFIMVDIFYLDESVINLDNLNSTTPIIIAKYTEIELH